MADEQIVTSIVAKADLSSLVAEVHKATASLQNLQQELSSAGKTVASQVKVINNSFGETLRSTGQFSSHFVTLHSDVEKFGKNLDAGRLKLRDYYGAFNQHAKQSGGLIRDLAKQQVMLQNAVMQPLGRNAQGLMQYNVHIPRGLDAVKNKANLARMELQIMNRALNEGATALINWGKNTQWAGRQLTVGLTVPLAGFGAAAAKAFREADQELVRLTKVYGDVAGTTAKDLTKVRAEIAATSKELAASMGVNFKETISLAADIAATGKTGEELIGSLKETTRLAVLGEVDRAEAMKATLAIQSAFKQNTEELSESINFLNAVENQTSTTLNDLVEAIPKAGPVIKGLGGSVQDLALYLTAMREGGINASEGANALKSALASLINPTDVAVAKFEGFGIDLLGIVQQNAGDTTKTLLALQSALDQLDPLQKQQAIEQLFGKFQFSRLNALFENLGKQGSQTLQVLDLMKASAGDLESLAGRELAAVTESASGKYKRAIESLRAELSVVGEDFLEIGTKFIDVVTKLLKFLNGLPEPVKKLITAFGGLTAVAGPMIMLTGVLANFAGYLLKGATNLKALLSGNKGWRMLTPEIVAADSAAKNLKDTFYSDAQAAAVLEQALRNLVDEFRLLEQATNKGVISVQPTISTMANNLVMQGGTGRVVDTSNPLVGDPDTRAFSHINPRKSGYAGQLFGVVPGAVPVNRKLGATPQMYMTERLPNIEGLTSVGGVSTGIVAAEAAKFHALMGTLGMQTQAEVDELKKVIALGGTVSSELLNTYDDLLPITSKFANKAAQESALIVSELRAAKITVDEAKIRIMSLNAQIEKDMMAEVSQYAALKGRSIDFSKAPLMDQPVTDATGKYTLRDLFKRQSNKSVLEEFGRLRGVRTFGAPYSIDVTKLPKFNQGGPIVPGPNVNADVVPAMLTPGEFVVNREATARNLPLLQAINGRGSAGPGYNDGTDVPLEGVPREKIAEMFPDRFRGRGNIPSYRIRGTAGNYIGPVTDPEMLSRYPDLVTDGRISVETMNSRMSERPGIPYQLYMAAMRSSTMPYSGSTNQLLASLSRAGIVDPSKIAAITADIDKLYAAHLKDMVMVNDNNNRYWQVSNTILKRHLSDNPEAMAFWNKFSAEPGYIVSENLRSSGEPMRSPSMQLRRLTVGDRTVEIEPLTGSRGNLFAHSRTPAPLMKRIAQAFGRSIPLRMPRGTYTPGAYWGFNRNRRNSGGIIRGYNAGGRVPGYTRGGGVATPGRMFYGENQPPYLSAGYMAQRVPLPEQPKGPGMFSRLQSSGWLPQRGESSQMGMGAMMGYGMLGTMGGGALGGAVGGNAGMMIGSIAGGFLPQLITGIKNATAGAGGLLSVFGSVAKVLKSLTIPGAILTVLGLGIKKFLDWKKSAEDAGKANRLAFGGTEESFASVGIKGFKTMSDRIKEVNESLELHKAKVKSTYESYTKTGTPGLTLTIKELREAIDKAKESQKDYVEGFNNIDSSKVVDYASKLKAQFVAMGMSAQEATNQIYAIIRASEKAGQALSAITSKDFVAVSDTVSAINMLVKGLKKELESEDFNAEEFNRGLDTLLNSVTIYKDALVGTKDENGKVLDQADALAITMEKISKSAGARKKISEDNLNALKSENILYQSILGAAETIESIAAKIMIYNSGFADIVNLAAMGAADAAAFAKNLAIVQNVMNGITEDTRAGTKNPMLPLALIIERVKKESEDATNKVNKLKKVDEDYYKNKIKSIEKLISSLQKEREARLKALDVQEESQSYEIQLSQAQIRYKQAIATGDLALAAQEQLSIEQLVSDRQRQLTRDQINNSYDAKIEKLEAQIEKLQNALKSEQDSFNAKTAAATQKAADLAQLQNYRDRLEAIAMRSVGGKLSSSDSMEISNIFKEMSDAGGEIAKAAKDMQRGALASRGLPELTSSGPKSISWQQSLVNSLNKQVSGNAEFKDAVDLFYAAVRKFAGDTTTNIGDSSVTVRGAGSRGGVITSIKKSVLQNAGVLLDKGEIFTTTGGKKYEITGFQGDNAILKKKALGGYMSAGNIALVGERGPEVVKFNQSGFVYPNVSTAPMFNVGGLSNPQIREIGNIPGYGQVAQNQLVNSKINDTMGGSVINITNSYSIPQSLSKEEVGKYIVDLQKKELAKLGTVRNF